MKARHSPLIDGAWLCLAAGLMALAAGAGCRSNGSPRAAAHPRLFFSRAELPAIRQRARTTHRRYVDAARRMFEWDTAADPPMLTTPRRIDAWASDAWYARLVNASMLYAATGDREVLARVGDWVDGLCAIRPATGNSFTYGHYALALATVYDVAGPDLPGDKREALRRQLAAVAQGLYESATGRARGWWKQIYLHHDHWVPTAGMGVAALALAGENDRWETWYDQARSELGFALSLLGDDGAWHEGAAGWAYGMSSLLPFLEAARNVAGDDFYARSPWLAHTARARVLSLLPDGTYVCWGDDFRDGRYHGPGSTPAHLLRLLARRFADGHAQWLADQEEPRNFARLDRASRQVRATRQPLFYSAGWSFVWYDPSVEPTPPTDLRRTAVLDNLGYVIARSSWHSDAAAISFRAGPLVGHRVRDAARRLGGLVAQKLAASSEHAQMDQNAFTFFLDGKWFVAMPEYGARQSARHATLLIGGRQQMKENPVAECRLLRHESTDRYVYLCGDATEAYPEGVGLQRFHRHLVWLKPDVLVVCDDVRAEKPVAVQWRMHPWRRMPAPEVSDRRITVRSAKAADAPACEIRFLQPHKLTMVGPTREPIPDERKAKTLGQLRKLTVCGARSEPAERTTFLAVLGRAGRLEASELAVTGGAGAVVGSGDSRTAVVFFDEPLARRVQLSWTTDAARTLVVGLPAALPLSVRKEAITGGRTTFNLAPGGDRASSFEGTLIVAR